MERTFLTSPLIHLNNIKALNFFVDAFQVFFIFSIDSSVFLYLFFEFRKLLLQALVVFTSFVLIVYSPRKKLLELIIHFIIFILKAFLQFVQYLLDLVLRV